ncbi:Sensor histidine kinase RcsC [Candidatus Lokiarchaeum ossiferum]|uniref:Sensor histidine kinase RcsC n=1 Tax=Candidatus Lokiarchaeum ossiferum TaxID=2951803 RepID=A0ABY6HXF2_9ARCH|nr:Sensor histidine kinase RcsC [Candidatus Lokiarchaeum sp. B-35]
MSYFEEKNIRNIVNKFHEGLIFVDREGKVQFINHIGEKITGWTENLAKGKAIVDVFRIFNEKTNIQYVNLTNDILNTDIPYEITNPIILRSRNHQEKDLICRFSLLQDKNSTITGYLIYFTDITEKKKFEREFQNALRLNSLGKLSSGIAHDFNNVLTTILGNISLAKLDVSEEEEIFSLLTEAELGIEKARIMTQQLLSFSNDGVSAKETIDIAHILQEFVSFTLSGSNVTCEYLIADDLWNIEVDKTQINQVIHNVVINAVQAMPIGGTINIEAHNVQIPSENSFNVPEGNFIRIVIQDHGIGIDPVDLPHLFDPFYQSNLTGKGMGLTVVHDIIVQHGGFISIDSELDVGTTVIFYLPAVESKVAAPLKEHATSSPHSGKVLIMDDEDVIRRVLGKMLKQLGYLPTAVANGDDAIQIYQENMAKGTPFSAVILDLTIRGGMGGEETVKRLLQIDPKLKAIASSGYSTDKIMTNFSDFGFSGTLIKPYKVKELEDTLADLFDAFST